MLALCNMANPADGDKIVNAIIIAQQHLLDIEVAMKMIYGDDISAISVNDLPCNLPKLKVAWSAIEHSICSIREKADKIMMFFAGSFRVAQAIFAAADEKCPEKSQLVHDQIFGNFMQSDVNQQKLMMLSNSILEMSALARAAPSP